ncbi:MAG: hypothetical protein LRZ97_00375 [Candidatus Pacebacteria bacterium]|jgi:hypothetical protein|nr:hypothetical protein [Candidatus Paceibacterota bacterium]
MNSEETGGFMSFILWLAWVVIVVLVLGGAAYLFVGGSRLFSDVNTLPIVVYRQINTNSNTVAVNGSIVMPTSCYRLELDTQGDTGERVLDFTLQKHEGCKDNINNAVPETFFTEFVGDEYTKVRVVVEGVEQRVILR